jgi:hypothetical protein
VHIPIPHQLVIVLAFGIHQHFFQGRNFSVADLFDRAGEFGVIGIEDQLFANLVLVVVIEDAPIDPTVVEEIPGILVRSTAVKDYQGCILFVFAAAADLEDV